MTLFICLLAGSVLVQSQNFRGPDRSPLDVAYLPDNFAHDHQTDKPVAKVIYSRPQKKDREIFGKMIPYGKVWRTGANEATEIKFFQDVTLAGKKVAAGTYALFTIPEEKEWTIILNSALDVWGAYSYDEKQDVLRVTAPATAAGGPVEYFTIQFADTGKGQADMLLAWDTTVVRVPVGY